MDKDNEIELVQTIQEKDKKIKELEEKVKELEYMYENTKRELITRTNKYIELLEKLKDRVSKDKIREIIEELENEEKALRKDFEKHRVQLFELYKKVVLIEGYKKLLEEE